MEGIAGAPGQGFFFLGRIEFIRPGNRLKCLVFRNWHLCYSKGLYSIAG
jgi:hypothetical protein